MRGGEKRPLELVRNALCWWPAEKYVSLDTQAISLLLKVLHSPMGRVCLKATKAFTMLPEAPEGWKVLQAHTHTFRVLEKDSDSKAYEGEAYSRRPRSPSMSLSGNPEPLVESDLISHFYT